MTFLARPWGSSAKLYALGLVLTVVVVTVTPQPAIADPLQEDPSGDAAPSDGSVDVNIDIEVSLGNAAAVSGTLDDLSSQVESEWEAYSTAEQAVSEAVTSLTDVNATIQDLQLQIEDLTALSDGIIVSAYINPPSAGAADLLSTETTNDLAIKQSLLGLQADSDADVLEQLDESRDNLDDQLALQEEARTTAEDARADAVEAMANLEAALSTQAQFMVQVRDTLDGGGNGEVPPGLADEAAALNDHLAQIEEETAYQRALEAVEREAQAAASSGAFVCPVQGDVSFSDTWGAARSGGRSHQGTDMMAGYGTPTVAPVSGEVVHKESGLGGLTWYVYGDDGNTYYGAHLDGYENVGAGRVEAGTIIGFVGASGNAQASAPHLHFEYHPGGGSAVNPYSMLVTACG